MEVVQINRIIQFISVLRFVDNYIINLEGLIALIHS